MIEPRVELWRGRLAEAELEDQPKERHRCWPPEMIGSGSLLWVSFAGVGSLVGVATSTGVRGYKKKFTFFFFFEKENEGWLESLVSRMLTVWWNGGNGWKIGNSQICELAFGGLQNWECESSESGRMWIWGFAKWIFTQMGDSEMWGLVLGGGDGSQGGFRSTGREDLERCELDAEWVWGFSKERKKKKNEIARVQFNWKAQMVMELGMWIEGRVGGGVCEKELEERESWWPMVSKWEGSQGCEH